MSKRCFTQTFGVVGAIIAKQGKVLLVRETKEAVRGQWSHPAGWIDLGEDVLVSVKREVKEETGFEFTPTHILGIYSLVKKELNDIHHPIKIIFLGNISEDKKSDLADDVSETRWFTMEEIKNMDSKTLRDVDIKKMIKDYSKGQKHPLSILTHTVDKS